MGVAAVWGYALVGIEAVSVRVEAHVRRGLPGISIVGMPGVAVREAKERIRSGAASSGVPLPPQRITVNLSPADVRKEGPGFDLPVALAVLAAAGYIPSAVLRDLGAFGEVALDGTLRGVRGALPLAEAARRNGCRLLVLPVAVLSEACEVDGLELLGVRSLSEAMWAVTAGDAERQRIQIRGARWLRRSSRRRLNPPGEISDMRDVAGHQGAKRALEIAAAGAHHLLLVGPPGSAKTMLARRIPGILPEMTADEALDVARVWSAAGLREPGTGVTRRPPFRAPHHTVSRSALIGGGPQPRPGEVSLAHHGVLFLDELPEFSRDALEGLRQPLEEGSVTISRRGGACTFPAKFTLVAAMNPCPCGFFGDPVRPCRCGAVALAHYLSRLSGPLVDRVDLQVTMPPLSVAMLDSEAGDGSSDIRNRVVRAREFRAHRLEAVEGGSASVGPRHPSVLEKELRLSPASSRLLRGGLSRGLLGGRGYARVLRISRTIADLDQSISVLPDHVAEALSLRLAGIGPAPA